MDPPNAEPKPRPVQKRYHRLKALLSSVFNAPTSTTGRKLFQQAMMCVVPTRVLSTPANLILNVACSSNDADHVSQLLSNNAPLHCWIVESIRRPLMHFKDLSADKQWYYCTCSTSHNHYICTMHFIIRRRHNSNVNTTASAMIACDNSKTLDKPDYVETNNSQ